MYWVFLIIACGCICFGIRHIVCIDTIGLLSIRFSVHGSWLLYTQSRKWGRMIWPSLYTHTMICHHADAICKDLGIRPPMICYGPRIYYFSGGLCAVLEGMYMPRTRTVYIGCYDYDHDTKEYIQRSGVDLIHCLAHELRHKWQADNGIYPNIAPTTSALIGLERPDEVDADDYADRWIVEHLASPDATPGR